MQRAAIYCRVSTDEQRHGWSLRGQLENCTTYCKKHDYRIVRVAREIDSGRDPTRPALHRILQAADRGEIDTIIVWRRDRFGRDPIMNGVFGRRLTKRGVRIESLDMGRREPSRYQDFIDTILDAASLLEAQEIADRMQTGRETAARAGKWPSRPPYGYQRHDDGFHLEPHPREAPEVQYAFRLSSDGQGVRSIAAALEWSTTTVRARLACPTYKGSAQYKKIRVPVPALIDPTTWDTVQRGTARRRRDRYAPRPQPS